MLAITNWLIKYRDQAADTWLASLDTKHEKKNRQRLATWDTLLGAWTRNGTRRT